MAVFNDASGAATQNAARMRNGASPRAHSPTGVPCHAAVKKEKKQDTRNSSKQFAAIRRPGRCTPLERTTKNANPLAHRKIRLDGSKGEGAKLNSPDVQHSR